MIYPPAITLASIVAFHRVHPPPPSNPSPSKTTLPSPSLRVCQRKILSATKSARATPRSVSVSVGMVPFGAGHESDGRWQRRGGGPPLVRTQKPSSSAFFRGGWGAANLRRWGQIRPFARAAEGGWQEQVPRPSGWNQSLRQGFPPGCMLRASQQGLAVVLVFAGRAPEPPFRVSEGDRPLGTAAQRQPPDWVF